MSQILCLNALENNTVGHSMQSKSPNFLAHKMCGEEEKRSRWIKKEHSQLN